MKKYYLITTEHIEKGLLFRDDEDFAVAMNHVAILAHKNPETEILSFILMSNHVHFVLYCSPEDATAFLNSLKKQYSKYLNIKYSEKEYLRGNGVHIEEISPFDNGREIAIAYVQMNCVAANICAHPSYYQWGSGDCFFNLKPPQGKPLKQISIRERSIIFHSRAKGLPDDWLLSLQKYILPGNYVKVQKVESIYHTPKNMEYYLRNSSKARKRLEISELNLPAFKDQTILAALPDLCRSLFDKENFALLNDKEQTEFCRQIRYRFSAEANQIARVCGISYAEAARILDKV